MWIVWFLLGIGGLWYIIKKGIINPQISLLERITYCWLSLPLIAMYLLFGFIIVIVPVIAIVVLLEDIPVLGVFVLVSVILVAANVIKNWNNDESNKNAFADAVEKIKAKGEAERKNTSNNSQQKSKDDPFGYHFTNLKG